LPALRTALASIAFACWASGSAMADPLLADFPYPYPVQTYQFRSQGQPLSMAYMDVHPAQPNGKTIVLLHGKNFCGATWEETIRPLRDAGYRLVVPDQIGFCKSTKPQAYQFSLHQLALNTRFLLQSLGIEKPIIMGHSMGGMLAMRYVISFPGETSALVLVNPIGLEDWKAKGVPFSPVDQLFEREQKTSFETVKQYQQSTYYAGDWKPEYDRWVNMLVGMYRGAGGRLVAWSEQLIAVYDPPPAPRVVITPSARPGFVYIQGRWIRNHNRWAWRDGYWVRERAGYVYNPGRWTRRPSGGYVWVEGRWHPRRTGGRVYIR